MKIKQNFKIEWSSVDQLDAFIDELKDVCDKVNIFRGMIGQVHFNVLGEWDGDCIEDVRTVSDVIFDFRNKGIRLLAEYSRKQQPQRFFLGSWEMLK